MPKLCDGCANRCWHVGRGWWICKPLMERHRKPDAGGECPHFERKEVTEATKRESALRRQST